MHHIQAIPTCLTVLSFFLSPTAKTTTSIFLAFVCLYLWMLYGIHGLSSLGCVCADRGLVGSGRFTLINLWRAKAGRCTFVSVIHSMSSACVQYAINKFLFTFFFLFFFFYKSPPKRQKNIFDWFWMRLISPSRSSPFLCAVKINTAIVLLWGSGSFWSSSLLIT